MIFVTSEPRPLPALFISHGAPLFAIEPGDSGPALTHWGQSLMQQTAVRGVVVMSPHWQATSPAVMTNPQPATWHDFGGFPPALYQLQYPAPGDPVLAQQVLDLLRQNDIEATADPKRPFDHGAWVPLVHLLPQATLPVVQVALPQPGSPAEVYAMGRALRGLRRDGVLVLGTGSMTHNLGEFFGGMPPLHSEPAPYVTAFSRWVESALTRGDKAALLDYRRQAPEAERAHPSDDHFLPLFFTLGAAGWGEAGGEAPTLDYITREVMYRMLAMDSFAVHSGH